MTHPPNRNRDELHRVVLATGLRGIEQKAENLRIGLGSPACEPIQEPEHQDSAEERVQQVKDGCSHDEGQEKQLPLRSHEREGSIECSKYGVTSSFHYSL